MSLAAFPRCGPLNVVEGFRRAGFGGRCLRLGLGRWRGCAAGAFPPGRFGWRFGHHFHRYHFYNRHFGLHSGRLEFLRAWRALTLGWCARLDRRFASAAPAAIALGPFHRIQPLDDDARYGVPGQLLDRFGCQPVVGRGESESAALASGAPGAADAVDIIFGMMRYVEIEHMA